MYEVGFEVMLVLILREFFEASPVATWLPVGGSLGVGALTTPAPQ